MSPNEVALAMPTKQTNLVDAKGGNRMDVPVVAALQERNGADESKVRNEETIAYPMDNTDASRMWIVKCERSGSNDGPAMLLNNNRAEERIGRYE